MRGITLTQALILTNKAEGRRADHGRPFTQSAAAGWGCSADSCIRKGWLDRNYELTDAGRAMVEKLRGA